LLSEIREMADVIIDTSEHTVHTLRDAIKDRFAEKGAGHEMSVSIMSFGYRHGLPRGADMMLDVRFLPNPHFVPELRALTGRDQPVIDYLNSSPEVLEALERFTDLLAYLLPKFQREGKSYLTIAVGCTGGHHRSVMMADALNERLARLGHKANVIHRDIAKDPEHYR
ncbi:MAG TPA: RNase adapter RapZ, partial [Blastocatellia bacterium]|nr:RNase adapter RapZ [Blastocatellia bacterium]